MSKEMQKVQDLLRMAKSKSGNVHEAHLAAQRAFKLAKKYDLGGQVVAHCLVAQNKAAVRLRKSQAPSYLV